MNKATIDAFAFQVWARIPDDLIPQVDLAVEPGYPIDLAITPGGRPGDASPLGTKGPRRLDDYVRMVAHALIRKGFSKSHAIATAKNSLKRWRRGGGHVRPQVRAGAAAHLGVQAGLDHRLSVPAPASAQDGPRVTMGTMATSSKNKGLAKLLKAEAKKRGLKVAPPTGKKGGKKPFKGAAAPFGKKATTNLTTPRQALEAAVTKKAAELDLSITAEPGTLPDLVERRVAVAQELAARRAAASS